MNCWNPLRAAAATAYPETEGANAKNAVDWAISSQALQECSEGSSTRAWSPERTVKPHEFAPREGRYSQGLRESVRSADKELHDNKRPYSGKLDNLSKFPVMELIQKVLKNDAVKTFDRLAWSQFNSTLLRVVSTNTSGTVSLTTNGTATATNSSAYGNAHAKTIVDTMKERNIPAYLGDDYYALAWPSTLRTFKNNLETIHQYSDTGFKLIMNGEIGRYENVRYVEQTNITKGISTDGINSTSTGTNGAWVNNLSDWIFFFGNDTVAEAIATPEEMRGKIPSDYGRSKGVAWYYLGGFGIVHTLATNCRIVKWDSAA